VQHKRKVLALLKCKIKSKKLQKDKQVSKESLYLDIKPKAKIIQGLSKSLFSEIIISHLAAGIESCKPLPIV
jgi:hypothetical protein